MPLYEFAGKKPRIAAGTFVHPLAVIIGDAAIGSNCFLGPGVVIRADFGPILIGDGTSIQDNTVIHVTPGDQVVVRENVIIGHNALLHDNLIHTRSVVGMGAILLQHVVCEEGVLVAAGSVIPQGMRIPAGKLVAGNPAKIIRDVTPEQATYIAQGLEEYHQLTRMYLKTMKEIVCNSE